MNEIGRKLAKAVRVLTTAPVFALILCTILYVLVPGSFASLSHYLWALGFLVILPLLAYPVAWVIPALRKKGRPLQRNLAVIFSIVGYVGGFLFAMLAGGTATEKILFGTYLLSGITIGVCTALHFKASGHTCGCSGPIAMLAVTVSPWFLLGYGLLTPIIWSSKKLGRHTGAQLAAGVLIPVAAMFLCRARFLI